MPTPFVAKTYTNGTRTEVANSPQEEADLLWKGWYLVGTYTPPEPVPDAATLAAAKAYADTKVAAKADLVTGRVPDTQIPTRLQDTALRAAFGLPVAATVTTSATLAGQKHNPVDATTAGLTMALPAGQAEGTLLSIEKTDATTNAVTISGNMRGIPAQTIQLLSAHEVRLFSADSAGSWWPIADHRTKASLDSSYVRQAPPPSGGDDRPILQALMVEGVTVQLQPGTYLIGSKGNWPAYAKGCLRVPANSRLIGAGRGRTIVKAADTLPPDSPLIFMLEATDIEIAHFTLDGNKQRIPTAQRGGVEDEGLAIKGAANRLSIHHMHIHDTGQDCIDFDHTQGSSDVDVSYCLLENAGGLGLHNGCPGLLIFKTTIRNNCFDRNSLGVVPVGGTDMVWSDMTMRDCQVYGNAKYQVVIEGGGNTADNLVDPTPVFQDSFRQRIVDSYIDASAVAGSNGIYLQRIAKNVLIADSTIVGNATGHAITSINGAAACVDVTIDNCDINSAATAFGTDAINVTGLRFRVRRNRISGGNRGLSIDGNNPRIEGNDFTAQPGRSLVPSATSLNGRVVGNTFDAAPSESITLTPSTGWLVEQNAFNGKTMSGFTGNTIRRNTGSVITEAYGAAVIPDTAQTVSITHGLRAAPTVITVGTDVSTPAALSTTGIGATTFSIRRAGTTGAQNVFWYAQV